MRPFRRALLDVGPARRRPGGEVMRARFLGGVVAFASATMAAGIAGAADLPAKAPAMAPIALYNWTGCYIGGQIGGVFGDDTTTNRVGETISHHPSGFAGGGQIGC